MYESVTSKFKEIMEDKNFEARTKILIQNMLEDMENKWEKALYELRKGPKKLDELKKENEEEVEK